MLRELMSSWTYFENNNNDNKKVWILLILFCIKRINNATKYSISVSVIISSANK